MASNPYVNKVALADGTTLIDLTNDDVTAGDVKSGILFHKPNGESGVGSLVLAHYYTGSSAPSSSLGNDGDIYLQA